MAPQTIIISGTGTDVGKTFVSCQVLRYAKIQGIDVRAVKPIESGTNLGHEEDGVLLAAACDQLHPPRALTRLAAPLAPPVAADLENIRLDHHSWVNTISQLSQSCDLLVIETAGGLLSPMTWDYDALQLAKDTNASLVIVAANRLGCIHDILATLDVLESKSIPIVGVVLNEVKKDQSSSSNGTTLSRLKPDLPIFEFPHASDQDVRDVSPTLKGLVDAMRTAK